MKIRLLILSLFCLFLCIGESTFAVEFPWDCDLVVWTYKEKWSFESLDILWNQSDFMSVFEPIIWFNNLNQAFLNLKKTCCTKNQNFQVIMQESCQTDKPYFFEGNVPNSYYIYDYILDIMMRRLDWEAENYYLLDSLDPKWQEWRQLTSEIMETIERWEKTTPKFINDNYQDFWQISPDNLLFWINELPSSSLDELVSIMQESSNQEILEKYEDWTLGERYYNVCNISAFLYAFLYKSHPSVSSLSQTKWKLFLNGENQCLKIIDQRLDGEANYIELITIKKSNMMLTDSVNDYLNTYLWERLMNLEELIMNTKVRFLRVAKAVPKLISNVS